MEDLKHLRNGDYNPDIDYCKVVAEYNAFVESGKHIEAKEILREYGGIIALVGNMDKQRRATSKQSNKAGYGC